MKRIVALVMFIFCVSSPNVWAEPCDADTNCDQKVDLTDLVTLKSEFLSPDCGPCIPVPIPKTGQTTSYATGDDGDLEKGVVWPNPRFTDNGNGTVKDNMTGLIWLKDASCLDTRTWNLALSECNGLSNGSCGLTDGSSAGDWRLPNVNELISMIDRSQYGPALTPGHPFTNVRSDWYWTSSTVADYSQIAWAVELYSGLVDAGEKYSGYAYVWPVRDSL